MQNPSSKESGYQFELQRITTKLKENYHEFNTFFNLYNLEIGHDLNILYKKRNFTKLRGYWQEIKYESIYTSEIDFIIYCIFKINLTYSQTPESQSDLKNFLFFKEQVNTPIKPNTGFIKILYYLSLNFEFVYKDIFREIGNEIYDAFKNKIFNKTLLILIEVFGYLLLILFFFFTLIKYYFLLFAIFRNNYYIGFIKITL